MRIALLAIGDRDFYLDPVGADQALAAVRVARESGDWVDIRTADGTVLTVLIPSQALLVFKAYDIEDAESGVDDNADDNEWLAFYDL